MKRGFVLFALVAAIVLAFAGVAVATWADSGTWAWFTTGVNSGTGAPHTGYALTTQKCGVCHAVHNANSGEVLLSTTIAGACDYCHVGGAGGYVQVYDGYTTLNNADTSRNHYNACTSCHAVHGANTLRHTGFILKATTSAIGSVPTPVTAAGTTATPGGTTSIESSESQWCAEACHRYTAAMDPMGAGYNYWQTGYNGRSHVMTDLATPNYTNSAANFSGAPVAWAVSTTCENCHNSTSAQPMFLTPTAITRRGSAFPHYSDGVRFLTVGSGGGTASGFATDQHSDGVCLRCHVDSGGTNGVNKTF